MTRSSSEGVLRALPTDRHIRMGDDGRAVEVVDVRQRFGGIDIGASVAGALAALGVTVLLGGVAGSIGTVGYQLDAERGTDALSAGGLVTGLVVLLAAFLIGGWVAGRMARYDGGKNGLLTAVWFIALAAVLAGAGAWLGDKYDLFRDLHVPQWFSNNATTTSAIVSGVIAALVMLAAGFLGGMVGARYHTRADEYLAAEERDLLTHQEPLAVVDQSGHEIGGAARTEDRAQDRSKQEIASAPQGDAVVSHPVAGANHPEAREIDLRDDSTTADQQPRREDVDLR